MAAHKIDEGGRAGDIAADHPEGLAEGALDHSRAMHDAITLGNTAAPRAVEPHGVHLVEIGHGTKTVGDVAQFANRGYVAVHRIDRLEADELGPLGRHTI